VLARASALPRRYFDVKTILIAAVPAAVTVIANALGSVARMMTAHTLDEAVQAAVAGVDLIIAGTYFDNGRMFDLLRRLKEDARTQSLPVLCVRGVSAPHLLGAETTQPTLASLQVVASASEVLGAAGYIDLFARQQAVGLEQANAELRESVQRHLH